MSKQYLGEIERLIVKMERTIVQTPLPTNNGCDVTHSSLRMDKCSANRLLTSVAWYTAQNSEYEKRTPKKDIADDSISF